MLSYFLKYMDKKIESKKPRVSKTNKIKLMLLSKCAVCDSKKFRSIKMQELFWK